MAILGVLYDTQIADITAAWLIPSLDFDHLTRNQAPQRRVRVMAARLKGAGNVWVPFRCQPKELADRLIATLSELGGTPVEQSGRPTLR